MTEYSRFNGTMNMPNTTENMNSTFFEIGKKPRPRSDVEILLSGMYITFYAIGVTGNLLVLTMISSIFLSRNRTGRWSHVYLYILALATADMLALSCVPLVVTDLLRREWVFGRFLCKFHYMTECLNKALSPLLLTMLSFDRFIGVCYPTDNRFRRPNFALGSILAIAAAVLLLMMPIVWYADTVYVTMLRKYACTSFFMPNDIQMSWIYVLFAVGYCTPVLFLTGFYSCLVSRLRSHSKRMRTQGSNRSVRKVTAMSFTLVFFYVTCYSPYWTMLILPPLTGLELSGTTAVYVGYLVHLLPYANSAFNPILYAWLNNELRRSHAQSMSSNRDESDPLVHSTATRLIRRVQRRCSRVKNANGASVPTRIQLPKQSVTAV